MQGITEIHENIVSRKIGAIRYLWYKYPLVYIAVVQVVITVTHVVITLTLKFLTDFIVHQLHPVLGSKKPIMCQFIYKTRVMHHTSVLRQMRPKISFCFMFTSGKGYAMLDTRFHNRHVIILVSKVLVLQRRLLKLISSLCLSPH